LATTVMASPCAGARPPNTSTRHALLETDKRVGEVDKRFLAARVLHAVRLDDALGGTLPSAARETSNPRDIVVDGLASPGGVQPLGRLARVIRQDNAAAVAPGEQGSGSGDVDSATQRN
jgi:hypothetical protein